MLSNKDSLSVKHQRALKDSLSAKHQRAVKGLAECKALVSNLRCIQVKDIVKEVKDYLKTYSSAGMDISSYLFYCMAAQLDDETVKKVTRQVEFYFSDRNILRDTFLRNAINESENGSRLGLGEVKAEDVPEDTVEVVVETIKTKSTTLKIFENDQLVN
ncbi:La protein 1 [Tanacetum coccineum]